MVKVRKAKSRVYSDEFGRRTVENFLLDVAPKGIWFRSKRYMLFKTNITLKSSVVRIAKKLMRDGYKVRLLRYGIGPKFMKQWAIYKHE